MLQKARIFRNSAARTRGLPLAVEEPPSSYQSWASCIHSKAFRLVSLRSIYVKIYQVLSPRLLWRHTHLFCGPNIPKCFKWPGTGSITRKKILWLVVVSRQIYCLVFNVRTYVYSTDRTLSWYFIHKNVRDKRYLLSYKRRRDLCCWTGYVAHPAIQ